MSEIEDIIKEARDLEFKTKRYVNNLLPGLYSSKIGGKGLDFFQLREYVFGDDIRHIDWNVTARFGTPHIKEYVEERELNVFCVLDFSSSMFFGKSKSKRQMVLELVASILFAGIKNGDRVGASVFTDVPELFIPAKKGKKHIFKILFELIKFKPQNFGTNIKEELKFLKKVLKQRSLVFIISDFVELEITNEFKDLASYHDLILIRISDPLENKLPKVGYMMIEDLESHEQILVNTGNKTFQNNYSRLAKKKYSKLNDKIKELGLEIIEISESKKYQKELKNFFNYRRI